MQKYTVYRVVNNLNGKFYIGVHKTDNIYDSYMGSGKAIKAAISKYGKANFTKEILFVFDNKFEAYEKEKELTVEYFLNSNYNMKLGGVGGFSEAARQKGYENSLAKITDEKRTANGKKGYSLSWKNQDHTENGRKGGKGNLGKPKSEEHKRKLREAHLKRNSTNHPL